MQMNNAKEIKVHDTVRVNLNPLLVTDGQAWYAEVIHIKEDKTKGVTYYDVRFRGSDVILYDVAECYVYPITITGDVLPNGTYADIFYADKA